MFFTPRGVEPRASSLCCWHPARLLFIPTSFPILTSSTYLCFLPPLCQPPGPVPPPCPPSGHVPPLALLRYPLSLSHLQHAALFSRLRPRQLRTTVTPSRIRKPHSYPIVRHISSHGLDPRISSTANAAKKNLSVFRISFSNRPPATVHSLKSNGAPHHFSQPS